MNTPTNSNKLRIAIVGGGIAGLTCAISLKNCPSHKIELSLYEQASQITEIGAGVSVWYRTWGLLRSLGLEDDLRALLKEERSDERKLSFKYRISDRKDGFAFHEVYTKGGVSGFHRQDLQKTLLSHVPNFCHIYLSHRLIHCTERENAVKLVFENGVEEVFDILIAADGIKSVARESIPNEGIYYTGTDLFRGLIPLQTFAKSFPNHRALDGPIIYCGKSQHVVAYPISANTLINVGAFTSNLSNVDKLISDQEIKNTTRDEVLEHFSDWEEEVIQLLGSIENPSRWPMRDLRPMETYVSHRIALVGDAAHNMTPHLGAGAGQAMDDAYILGTLLSQGIDNWPVALQAFNSVRQPYGNKIQRRAREQGLLSEFDAPGFEDITAKGQDLTLEQMSFLRDTFTRNWTWTEDDIEEDLIKAIGFYNERTQ